MTATVSNTNITKATDSTPKEATSTIASQDVGLLFVREYYTFLNKKPHRLHAFYNKDSYFIRGDEGENVQTYQGQEEIRKKIEELNFEDCKVLVTQVDSQMSANDGILIQVLGEMCVMDGPSQKFSQTFFLAPQPNGYYVLNDIFRFLKDEVDIDYYTCEDDQQQQQQQNKREEVISEQAPAVKEEIKQEQAPEPITTAKVEEPAKKQEQEEKSIEPKVEEKETEKENIEEVKQVSQSKSSDEKKKKHHHPSSHKEEVKINGTADHSLKEANEKAVPATTTESPAAAAASPALTKPAAPKTWANVTANDPSKWGTQVSEAKGSVSPVTANVQTPKEATTQQPAPQQPAQQQSPQQQQPSQQQQPQQQQQSQQQSNQSNKEQRKDEVTNIFVKNVFSNINQDQLHEAFSKFGSIRSLNIVSNRNCAFVDFTTPEACQKALAQHKVNVGSSVVLAEERRQHGGGGGRYGGNRQQQSSGSGSGGNYRHQQGGNYRRNTGGGSGNNNSGRNAGSGGSGGNKSRSGGSGNNQK